MGGDCSAFCLRLDGFYQLIQIGLVGTICKCERCTVRKKITSARSSDSVCIDKWMFMIMTSVSAIDLTLLRLL